VSPKLKSSPIWGEVPVRYLLPSGERTQACILSPPGRKIPVAYPLPFGEREG